MTCCLETDAERVDTVAALDATQYIAVMAMMITHKSKLRMMNAIARDIT